MKVYANEVVDWVIARDEADAQAVVVEWSGNAEYNGGPWVPCADDHVVAIYDDSGLIEKTAAEWVAEQGRGFLASTEC